MISLIHILNFLPFNMLISQTETSEVIHKPMLLSIWMLIVRSPIFRMSCFSGSNQDSFQSQRWYLPSLPWPQFTHLFCRKYFPQILRQTRVLCYTLALKHSFPSEHFFNFSTVWSLSCRINVNLKSPLILLSREAEFISGFAYHWLYPFLLAEFLSHSMCIK